jgi:hypothetical protein
MRIYCIVSAFSEMFFFQPPQFIAPIAALITLDARAFLTVSYTPSTKSVDSVCGGIGRRCIASMRNDCIVSAFSEMFFFSAL